MKTLTTQFLKHTQIVTVAKFAGFYLVSTGTVFSMIKGTQMLCALI